MRTTSSVLSAALLVLVVACGDTESSTVAPAAPEPTASTMVETSTVVVPSEPSVVFDDLAFWQEFAIRANWREVYPTLRETVDAVDVVVIANVRSIKTAEPIKGDAPGADIMIVHLVMEVVTDVSGSGLKEFTLQLQGGPLDGEQYAAWVDDLSRRLPTGSAFFALRMSKVGYILNSWSIWVMTDQGLVAPLDPDWEQNRSYFLEELGEVRSYEELALYLTTGTR